MFSRGCIMRVLLKKSTSRGKKWMVTINPGMPNKSTVHFGASGYEDYTSHKDPERKARYLARHKARENWTMRGLSTAGFWSRWLLWNEPSLSASKKDITRRFGVKFVK
jgi:hypothetical protein